MIKNCICGLRRDPKTDPTFVVVTGIRPGKDNNAEIDALPMFACRGCGVTYIKLAPVNKVVLAG